MSALYKLMFDASTPPGTAPAGYDAVAGYIGGDTPHVWTKAEWQRFGSLKKLPIYVRSDPGAAAEGSADASTALSAVHALGVPTGHAIVCDLETAVDQAYVDAFENTIKAAKYEAWFYGSADFIFSNSANSYWVADYTGFPFVYKHKGVRATQYAANINNSYDASTVKIWDYWFRLSRHWKF